MGWTCVILFLSNVYRVVRIKDRFYEKQVLIYGEMHSKQPHNSIQSYFDKNIHIIILIQC